ncbi:MAG TPA: efflux RND transporter permease subunit [Spirochaetota bacterium]|nr:efflux RND transporter permease subunit [Spirochaetota bacterium]
MRYFIYNNITAFMIFAALSIFGLIGLSRLPVALMPPTVHPGISVIIEYPGIAPEKIEAIITRPVEKIVKTVAGIEKIESISEDGKARINISFAMTSDIRLAALHVREKIGLIRSDFPRSVQEPVVLRYDPSDRPVVIATIELPGKSLSETRRFAEDRLKRRLQRVDGVSEITVAGGLRREIHVDVDRGALEARSLSFDDIADSIRNSNVSLSGGQLPCGGGERLLLTSYRMRDPAEIAAVALPPGRDGGPVVHIGDVAGVVDSFREPDDISRHNGGEKVTLYVQKAGGANTLEVCDRVLALLKAEPSAKTEILYNQGRHIRAAVNNVVSSCLWGMGIVVMVIYAFFRRRLSVFAIAISIPLSVIAVFACMYFMHIDLNVMSLSGLALGSGMVVDNCIILTESVFSRKKIDPGSIYEGTLAIRKAVIASTATTVIVFLPVLFGSPRARLMYGNMAFTVSAALIVSLAVSLILIPAVYAAAAGSTFLGPAVPGFLSKRTTSWKTELAASSLRFENALRKTYGRMIDFGFSDIRRLFTAIGVFLAASLIIFTFIKNDHADPGGADDFYVYLEFPTGTTLSRTDELVALAEARIQTIDAADKITTRVEKWRGTIAVSLKDSIGRGRTRERTIESIKRELNELLRPYGAFAFISEADELAARELGITIIGEDNETLRFLAKTAARCIGAVPGIEECVLRFREGKPAYTLHYDRAKAEMSAVSARTVADFFHGAILGPVISKLLVEDGELDVRMRFPDSQRRDIGEVLNYSIPSRAGSLIPARELVKLEETVEPTRIWRKNGRRCVHLTAKIGRLSYEEAEGSITGALNSVNFPPEYGYEYDDTVTRLEQGKRDMALLVLLSVVFVYMVLAALFESLILPLVIMTTVPMAAAGVMPVLFLTGTPFSVPVYMGLIILVGIVVNNGIVLVEAVRTGIDGALRGGEGSLVAYIKERAAGRFRPVLSTALTTVMGLFPALVNSGEGSGLWRPLALTVISGLSFATVLTLVVVPVACYLIYAPGGEKTTPAA